MIYAEIDKMIRVRLPCVTLHNCTGTFSSLLDASDVSVLLSNCLVERAQGTELREEICDSTFANQMAVERSLREVMKLSSLLTGKMDNEEMIKKVENQK